MSLMGLRSEPHRGNVWEIPIGISEQAEQYKQLTKLNTYFHLD